MDERLKTLDREGCLRRAVIREVLLPDGSSVCIRALSASVIVSGVDNAADVFEPANLLVHSLCDESGRPLFGEGEKSEAMSVDHMALKVILDAIVELNGLKAGGAPEKN
ncbi:MAG: hypothetical protein LBC79_06615 [Deltaproteobacteria bacterium]|jgi:hypothetical protein|nr:hypothetical protein [Deltaproteobacteria bacterium]